MIDLSDIHSMLQFPLIMVLAAIGTVIILRGTIVRRGDIDAPSPILLFSLGAFVCVIAAKQMFWHAYWILKASNRNAAALLDVTWIVTVLNAVIIIIGGAVLAVATRHHLGRKAPVVVSASILALTIISAIVVVQL